MVTHFPVGKRRFALGDVVARAITLGQEGTCRKHDDRDWGPASQAAAPGFLIVDGYGALTACKQAIEDYRARFGISEPIDCTGVYCRKR
jgi:hypothetical protein